MIMITRKNKWNGIFFFSVLLVISFTSLFSIKNYSSPTSAFAQNATFANSNSTETITTASISDSSDDNNNTMSRSFESAYNKTKGGAREFLNQTGQAGKEFLNTTVQAGRTFMGKAGDAAESFGDTTGQTAESFGKDLSPLIKNETAKLLGNLTRGVRDLIP
jgi:hypothetical protein